MPGRKRKFAILLLLGFVWALAGMSSGGTGTLLTSLFSRCEANVQVKTGTTAADATEITVVSDSVTGMGYVSIFDSATGASSNIQSVYGKNTASSPGDASNATVVIDAGDASENVIRKIYGGHSEDATNTENNTVTINSGTINDTIHGGQSVSGAVKNNHVNIATTSSSDSLNINSVIYGGYVNNASNTNNVSGNTVTIGSASGSGTINANHDIWGGYSTGTGDVDGNIVTIWNGNIGAATGGMNNGGGNTSNNAVYMRGGSVNGGLYGARVDNYYYAGDNRNVWNNKVAISNGTINGIIIGVSTNASGSVSNNSIDIHTVNSSDTIIINAPYIEAATSSDARADVSGNSVTIGSLSNPGNINITANSNICGAYQYGRPERDITNNSVTINSGNITVEQIIGGASASVIENSSEVTGNKVSILGGTINSSTAGTNIYGGANYITLPNSSTTLYASNVKGNSVEISGGTISLNAQGNIFGGYGSGSGSEKTVSENNVTVSGGTVNSNIYGGYNITGDAVNNTITLSGGTMSGDSIYGGYSSNNNTTNNIVNLYGTADISASSLYGGNQDYTGNTLNIGDASTNTAWTGGGQCVKNISNFENIYFNVIPWQEQRPALTITDGSTSDLSYTKINVSNVYVTNVSSLAKNQQMTLLDASRITDTAKKLQTSNIGMASNFTVGTSLTGKGALSLDENGNVIYTVTQGTSSSPISPSSSSDSPLILRAQEQTHKTLMGMAANMAALAVGNDFIGRTLDGLADVENEGKDGISCFAAYGGGVSKYETGSHIRANTWNAILGIGRKLNYDNKKKNGSFFNWGAFFEYGSGNYSTHDCDVRGDGSAQYTGGGLLAKWKNASDVYVEGSVRAGSVTDKASNMLHDALGGSYGYDTRANYLGAHVGLGKIYRFGENHELDVYGKFFYTRRGSVSFDAGGRYNLDAVTSDVLRVGVRYGMTGKKWNWFGGLAYEYEFDGKATGTADGAEIRAADIGGGSLRAEVGVVMKPSEESPWSMRMSAEGYCGERQGFGGTLSLTYAF